MLKLLSDSLKPEEQLTFVLIKQKGGALKVLVQPRIAGDADAVPKEAAEARAALSMPLVATLAGTDPDAEFAALLQPFADARQNVRDAYDGILAALKEAGKAGANARRGLETQAVPPTAPAAPAKATTTQSAAPVAVQPAATKPAVAGDTNDIFAV